MKTSGPNLILFFSLVFALNGLQAQKTLQDLYHNGNYQEVISQSTRNIAAGDTAQLTHYYKALSEIQTGQTMAAIASLENCRSLHPDLIWIEKMLAGQYYEAGDYVRAWKSYAAIADRDSSDIASWLKMAEIASFRQDYPTAIKALDMVFRTDSINLPALIKMGELLERKHSTGAKVFYERAYRHYPENQKVAYALANWYIQAKLAGWAIPVCEQMLRLDTTSIRFSKLLGFAYYKSGNPFDAIRFLEYANFLGDSTAFTYKYTGISYYMQADYIPAIEPLSQSLSRDSTDAEVHYFLGSGLSYTMDKEGAWYHLQRSLELMQPDPSVVSRIYSNQGNIRRLQGRYPEAYQLYQQAWEADTTDPLSLYFMGSILDNSLRRHKEALTDYQRFIDVLDRSPKIEKRNSSIPSLREIVEDRIVSLNEELFFRDED